MELLALKLERLSPDQRKEVEDFVDFLLYRAGQDQTIQNPAMTPPAIPNVFPPPLPVIESLPLQETQPVIDHVQHLGEAAPAPVGDAEEPSSLIREITTGGDEWVTRNYMDYGQFEGRSPLKETGKKFKIKVIQKNEQDSPHLLDWID